MLTPSEQALAVRRGAGLFKEIPRGVLAVLGKDRARFLHNVVSHDIRGLPPGQGRPACLLDRQGKVLFSFFVYAREEELLIETAPGAEGGLKTALGRYLVSEAAELQEATPLWRVLELHGPTAPQLLEQAGAPPAVRWNLLGIPGFRLWTEPGAAEELFERLLCAGESTGLIRASPETIEILRIEAGIPRPGKEITPDVILNELGREDFVSFSKGCYIGQEIVARIKHRAHPPRLLAGFLPEGERPPAVPCPVFRENQEAGTLTSSCLSPTLGKPIALGFLKFGMPEGGLQIQTAAGPINVRAVPLPFVTA